LTRRAIDRDLVIEVIEMKNDIRTRPLLQHTALAAALAVSCAVTAPARADNAAQLAASASSAAAHGNANASLTVEQRVREELRAVMAELIESGAFGDKSPQQISLDVDAPAQRVSNLGLLVDSAHAHPDGLHVLGVTPGGGAERMGLRAGDVLVALNGDSLANAVDAAADLRRAVDSLPNGGALAFDVHRDGRALTMSGALSSIYLPAMHLMVGASLVASNSTTASGMTTAAATAATGSSGCGRISDFDVAPRQQQLHSAKIMSIDGVAPGPTGAESFRVTAGTHTLKVAERIENRYLSFSDRQRESGLATRRYKTLVVDVAPGTTTLIAARLNDDKRNEWKDGAYWDPVAWKQVTEACQ
jgi:hypothetical protein